LDYLLQDKSGSLDIGVVQCRRCWNAAINIYWW